MSQYMLLVYEEEVATLVSVIASAGDADRAPRESEADLVVESCYGLNSRRSCDKTVEPLRRPSTKNRHVDEPA